MKNQKNASLGQGCEKLTQERMKEMLKCIDFMCDMHTLKDDSSECAVNNSFFKVKVETRVHLKNTSVGDSTLKAVGVK